MRQLPPSDPETKQSKNKAKNANELLQMQFYLFVLFRMLLAVLVMRSILPASFEVGMQVVANTVQNGTHFRLSMCIYSR